MPPYLIAILNLWLTSYLHFSSKCFKQIGEVHLSVFVLTCLHCFCVIIESHLFETICRSDESLVCSKNYDERSFLMIIHLLIQRTMSFACNIDAQQLCGPRTLQLRSLELQ